LGYILFTGCRWCDLPKGPQRASGSSGHRWLQRWDIDGTPEKLKSGIPGIARNKGKGILAHLIVDAGGMPLSVFVPPANGDERKQVEPLPEQIHVKTGKPGRPPKKIAADKGYDAEEVRNYLRSKGILPRIPKRKNAGKRRGRPVKTDISRFQVERTFSWLQRKFRRLAVRRQKKSRCFYTFLLPAVIFIRFQKLVGYVHMLRQGL